MRRYGLRDDQWERIKDILSGREDYVSGTAADNRLFVEGVLDRYRAGIPWRNMEGSKNPLFFRNSLCFHLSCVDEGRWMMKSSGFFDVEERLARLSGLGDQLEAFSRTLDFEVFRPDLDKAVAYSDGSKGGCPSFDPVLMFKILVIQTLNNLSDERTEYLINDRLSFMRFLGLGLSERVPDARACYGLIQSAAAAMWMTARNDV
ncbi:transposase, partial [Acetobacter orleanensis]